MKLCFPHNKKRIVWIDYCRALAVSLIVLEHVQYIHHVYEAISACAMPTFVFLSGCTFERSAKAPFLELLRKKFRTLIIPYIGFSAILFAFWFLALRNFGITYRSEATVADVLLQILYGTNSTFFVTPLWSLTCLFVVEILFWCLFRMRNKFMMITIIALLFVPGLFYRTYKGILQLPHVFWNFDQACFLLPFFAIGFITPKKNLVEKIFCSLKRNIFVFLVSVASFAIAIVSRENTTSPLFLVSTQAMMACFGLIAIIAICKSIRENVVLNFIGQNTMTIFALHIMMQGILRGALFKISPVTLEWIKSSFLGGIVLTIVSILALVPVILLINRFTPWLAGKKSKVSQVQKAKVDAG
jgi:fucose 4-O-acetylase-like acetyltransferase